MTGQVTRSSFFSAVQTTARRAVKLTLKTAVLAVGASTLLNVAWASQVKAAIDIAEVCYLEGNRFIAVQEFKTKYLLIDVGLLPSDKPITHEGFSYSKDPLAVTTKEEVEPDMFELMAEAFGGTTQKRDQWKKTYAGTYQGKIKVFDDLGNPYGTFEAVCHSAILEY